MFNFDTVQDPIPALNLNIGGRPAVSVPVDGPFTDSLDPLLGERPAPAVQAGPSRPRKAGSGTWVEDGQQTTDSKNQLA